ncbi:hypothetical protein A3D80_04585 [Candidatus Roizmanbacteria bacterium RIFCSPHIGHO2_02_FULL_40_13b]|uniref:Glycosyltransferase 2-like domain-containing protein n=1 Tax=Candidatus Roizmanbacteria bacterium RIFCSPHIGHO2_01_FULL_39_24 TaxID=1802032 RepID=A0A1F7GF97_9BACT|nr:MAG: hypothetical protein A2799_04015 [Candidatus Roizmanbacteria bacterium RIFCSPHIGHO2_01_FULL_39_24]OGK26437.1 MAG: hypothetical protein A3D80_04585 [Candidatus Roizmanbacteria bacterium RIFCSPHIGHO2_02_FULL_40_13b]OGK49374.1 MAG: hypothetical protein A3A56_02500 [Candidatus Roizmanbacteria bacterium RIFCSPLOWO2_01_FULL_40_32]OGK57535.1 MAG: hypothetical protein A3H83_03195 [Candidatus Roizmanbacteria bacterium RIFCSPLOWO2_02_FULL_39_8]
MITTVILSSSEDSFTKKLRDSLSFCDEILTIPVDDDFSSARNEGMKKAKNDWVLFIDSDEELSNELSVILDRRLKAAGIGSPDSIATLQNDKDVIPAKAGIHNDKIIAYYMKRRDFFWGKELKYGETHSARTTGIIRLVKKGSGKWVGAVHEQFKSTGETGHLNGFINHYPHQSIAEFLKSINKYSTIRALELHKQGTRTNVFQIVLYPFGKFWYTYGIKLGFLDGPAGFVYSFMMSFHSFLVRSKLFLKQSA